MSEPGECRMGPVALLSPSHEHGNKHGRRPVSSRHLCRDHRRALYPRAPYQLGTVKMRAIAVAGSLALLLMGAGPAGAAPLTETNVNKGVVELETMSANGASVRIGEDLANVTDDGATRRLLPIVGKGSLQNIIDLQALRGIDLAILPADG